MNISEMYQLLTGSVSQYMKDNADNIREYPRYPSSSLRGLWEQLEPLGFHVLGGGHFSVAVYHKQFPKVAIKLGFCKDDSGAAYTAFCRAHQGRVGIPELYKVERHEKFYMVSMKRYNPLEDVNEHELVGTTPDGRPIRRKREVWQKFHMSNIILQGEYSENEERFKELTETAVLIRSFFKDIAEFDLHEENAMIDPDSGELVITDPVSFSAKCAELDKLMSMEDLEKLRADAIKEEEKRKEERAIKKSIVRHNKKLRKWNKCEDIVLPLDIYEEILPPPYLNQVEYSNVAEGAHLVLKISKVCANGNTTAIDKKETARYIYQVIKSFKAINGVITPMEKYILGHCLSRDEQALSEHLIKKGRKHDSVVRIKFIAKCAAEKGEDPNEAANRIVAEYLHG